MMFRTLCVSSLAAMVQGAVIEAKPQQHLQKGEGAGKILTDAGMVAAAAGALAAATNAMASAQSSKSSDDDTSTTPAPGEVCDPRELLGDFLDSFDPPISGTEAPARFCTQCATTMSTQCNENAGLCLQVIQGLSLEMATKIFNPEKLTCAEWAADNNCGTTSLNKCFDAGAELLAATTESVANKGRCAAACTDCDNGEVCCPSSHTGTCPATTR